MYCEQTHGRGSPDVSIWQDKPPYPSTHEHVCPPPGQIVHDPPFWQGFGLHASAGTEGKLIIRDA